jgi:hypothetical protein
MGRTYVPRIGIGLGCLMAVTFCSALPEKDRGQASRVENNTFISRDNPKIRVSVDSKFQFLGNVPFTIDKVAGGYRYVFVRTTPDKRIQQMFIIQQEGFFPTSNDTYKYRITNPIRLGSFEYRHSVDIYNNDAEIREAPGKEGDVTKRFLEAHGYSLEPELVMSRFARPADSQHKHEIIFFCYENLSDYGHKLADYPEGSASPDKEAIEQKVDENCRNAFHVNH